MALTIDVPSTQTVTPLEAVWTIIQGQSKTVQKVLLARLEALYSARKEETPQQRYVRKTLSTALSETKRKLEKGEKMPSAYDLLNEL